MGLRGGIEVPAAGSLFLLFVASSWGAGCVLRAQRAPYYFIFGRPPWSRNHHCRLFTGAGGAKTQRLGAAEGVTQCPLESGSVPGAGWLQPVLLSGDTLSSLGSHLSPLSSNEGNRKAWKEGENSRPRG